ncbi:MAG: S41 family peptidase [Dehalococcoidia bacterium]|jgi:carboxyl-terminal processing protease
MTFKRNTILSILLAVAVLAMSLPMLGCESKWTISNADNQTLQGLPSQFSEISQAYQILQQYYVNSKSLDPTKLLQGAIKGMVAAVGDNYTVYFPPEIYKSTEIEYTGVYQGIGAYIGQKDNQIIVIAPIPGSPAEAAGIKAGDAILKIDGQTTDQMTPDEVSLKIRGPAGTKVALTLGRKDVKDPIELTITRMDVNVASVTSKMYDQIAYIRITQFILPTTDDFQKALQSSLDKGAKGIILDLRDNPGGILDQAVDVASEFLLRGIVVKVVDKDGKETVFRVKPGGLALNVPLIVLVNGNSASASEIVAGALQDNGRAKLAGTQTYGKASVQNIIRLEDGGAIKVTVAHYYTPNGKLISGTGLAPDYPSDLKDDDLVNWAVDYLNKIIAQQPAPALAK